MHFDILISGAGPAGLCLAQALSGQGLAIGIVEQQPQFSGRHEAFKKIKKCDLFPHSALLLS